MLALTFEEFTVRFVGTAEAPKWVAQDVCQVLGIRNTSQALANFKLKDRGVCTVYTPGDDNPDGQQMLTVTESGLYRLIFKSRKAITEKFQSWVFEEVLPSIRKYGTYPPSLKDLNNTDTPLPNAEQLEFMRSRAWEKAELEGKRMTWDEIAQRSGFDRIKKLGGCYE